MTRHVHFLAKLQYSLKENCRISSFCSPSYPVLYQEYSKHPVPLLPLLWHPASGRHQGTKEYKARTQQSYSSGETLSPSVGQLEWHCELAIKLFSCIFKDLWPHTKRKMSKRDMSKDAKDKFGLPEVICSYEVFYAKKGDHSFPVLDGVKYYNALDGNEPKMNLLTRAVHPCTDYLWDCWQEIGGSKRAQTPHDGDPSCHDWSISVSISILFHVLNVL